MPFVPPAPNKSLSLSLVQPEEVGAASTALRKVVGLRSAVIPSMIPMLSTHSMSMMAYFFHRSSKMQSGDQFSITTRFFMESGVWLPMDLVSQVRITARMLFPVKRIKMYTPSCPTWLHATRAGLHGSLHLTP